MEFLRIFLGRTVVGRKFVGDFRLIDDDHHDLGRRGSQRRICPKDCHNRRSKIRSQEDFERLNVVLFKIYGDNHC